MSSKLKAVNSVDQQIRLLQIELSQLDGDIKTKILQLPDQSKNLSLIELNRYSHVIRERLSQFDNKIEDFEQLVRQTSSKSVAVSNGKSSSSGKIDQYRLESKNNRENLRRATSNAMQTIEKRERDELLQKQPSVENDPNLLRQRQKQQQQQTTGSIGGVAGQSSGLTEGLTALVRQMDGQVKQSESVLTALIGSSQSLLETETEFKDMGGTIQSSGKLLSKYGRREITDKLLIFFGSFILFRYVRLYSQETFFGSFFVRAAKKIRIIFWVC